LADGGTITAAFCPRINGANPVICHDGRGASFWQGSVKFAGSSDNGSMGGSSEQRCVAARQRWTGGGRAPEVRLRAKLTEARDMSGLHRLPKMSPGAAASHGPSKMDRADECEDRVPENRLLVSLAQARALSERRGGRLLPGPESDRGGRRARWRSVGGVGEGPRFVRAQVIAQVGFGAGFGWRALPRSGSFADLPLVTPPTNGRTRTPPACTGRSSGPCRHEALHSRAFFWCCAATSLPALRHPAYWAK